MSAGLTGPDSMFSVREVPWHGVGAVLERPPASVAEAITKSGLGWGVAKEPIAVARRAAGIADVAAGWEEVDGFYATVRQDTRQVLRIVRQGS